MIVCICNNVNATTIKTAIEEGARTLDAISNKTEAASCCGKCQFKVNSILQNTLLMESKSALFVDATLTALSQ